MSTKMNPVNPKPVTLPKEASRGIAEREQRARGYWECEKVDLDDDTRPSWYQLMMFPYPSAEGLHVGNLYAFTGNDIQARWKRLEGYNVFEPIGFDAFGIHSENYAWKMGRHPAEVIPENIERFTTQMKRTGLMTDWSRAVDTTDPEYYRWTQWIFTELLKAGEAYQKEAAVNWCGECATVIANEQVNENGTCERHPDTNVETKTLKQWFFKTSTHASELLEQVEASDWSRTTLSAQREWIGRTQGYQIPLKGQAGKGTGINAFYTDPDRAVEADTLFVAPEHPMLDHLAEATKWREQAARLSVVARRKAAETPTSYVTGISFEHPLTGKPLDVIATDAMAMSELEGVRLGATGKSEADRRIALAAGLERNEANETPATVKRIAACVKAMLIVGAKPETRYRLSDWCVSRQRFWGPPIPVIHCDDCGAVPVPEADLPVTLPDLTLGQIVPDGSGQSPLARAEDWAKCQCPECGKNAKRETDVSDTFLDSAWYFLRYPSANEKTQAFNPEVTAKWLPVDSYIGGNEHAVLHLLYARYTTLMLHKLGHIPSPVPFKEFRAHGLIIKDGHKMSKSRGNTVNPDSYIETWGADALRTYLMFLGPFSQGGDFRDAGILGVHRFFERLKTAVEQALPGDGDKDVVQAVAKAHHAVRDHIGKLEYNTAIASMMEVMNIVRFGGRQTFKGEVEPLVKLLAPFAPHLSEDLWRTTLGHDRSVFDSGPVRTIGVESQAGTIDLPVQVNGKTRGTVTIDVNASEQGVRDAILAHPSYAKLGDWKGFFYKPGRIANIVIAKVEAKPAKGERKARGV